jgi:hypothetical protein
MPSEFLLEPSALAHDVLAELRRACLASPMVSASPLAGTFMASRGFAVSFTQAGRPQVEQRFAFLKPFLSRAIDSQPHQRVWSWPKRLQAGWRRRPNAFYLNLLLLESGAGVGAHVDTTLRELSGVDDARPSVVSVLYLEVPPRTSGGELVLARDEHRVATLMPEAGTLVHFRGDLRHEVTKIEGLAPGAQRASLVCEQYALPAAGVARMPRCRVQTQANFGAYLEAQRQKPLPDDLVLDP